jgi:DNA-binding SARP family transcriptional activator
MMNFLSLQLLGAPQVQLDGEPVTEFKSSKALALLIYLVVTRRPATRAVLAGLLWGDMPEISARRNLSKALSNLRSLVGDHIQIDRQMVRLASESRHWVDVAEFRERIEQDDPETDRLEQAVGLYRGAFLEGFYVSNAPDFETWMLDQRELLHTQAVDAFSRLADQHAQRGDLLGAIAHSRHLLRMDPAHEAAHRQLMQLLTHSGQRSAALAQFDLCRRALDEELGVEPAPETVALYERIRTNQEAPQPRQRASRVASAAPAPAPLRVDNATRLVGRQPEWQTLAAAWQRAARGEAHFCLIRGEAGIGKTRLAEELLAWTAGQDVAAARTRAYAAAGGLVYTPVIEWLRSDAVRPALAGLDPIWLREVARLLPELLVEHPQVPPPEPWTASGPGQWQRQRLFEALARAVLAQPRPLLLLLDDLQWCDAETLAWLHFLLHFDQDTETGGGARLLIVGTVRPEEVDEAHPLTPLLLALRQMGQIREIDLAPLDASHTAELAAQVTAAAAEDAPDARAAHALHRYTEGNPLFVVETLRSERWRDLVHNPEPMTVHPAAGANGPTLPPRVYAVIQSRLAQLSPAARNLVALAAVVGRAFSFELLHRASQAEEGDVARHLDELWRRGIIREQETLTYDFSHDRIREAAHLDISPVARPRLHRRMAGALEQVHADDLDPVSAQLAAHYEQVGDPEQAVDYYRRAAAVAHGRFADTDAVDLLYRALELVESLPATPANQQRELAILLQLREPLMVARGYSELALGEIGQRAIALAREVGDSAQLFFALRMLRLFYMMRGRYAEAQALSEQAITLVEQLQPNTASPSSQDSQFFIEAYYPLAHALFYQGEFIAAQFYQGKFVAAQERFERILGLGSLPVQPLVFAAKNAWMLGYPDRARQLACRAIMKARGQDNPHFLIFATKNVARLHHFMHHVKEMKPLLTKAIRLAEAHGISFFVILAKLFQGRLLAEEGEPERGIAQVEAMLTQLDVLHHAAFRSYFLGLLAECQACAGQFSPALDTLDRAMSYVERNGEGVWHVELVRLRGEYRLALGAPMNEVEACYQQAITIAQAQQAKSLELRATMSLARLWQQQGRRAEAREMLGAIYGWFTEGFKTADLREARALLAELGEQGVGIRK